MDAAAPAVLVVDDDAGQRTFVSEALERVGLATIEAASGHEALAIARAARPLAVVLDISMPGISGYETCHQLRALYGPALPIVFLSGERVEAYDRAAGLLIGADDYLVKPVCENELLARLRTLIERAETDAVPFTPREREVITLLAEGLNGREIADRLVIAPSTAAKHIEHVVGKLGVRSRAQAIAKAYRLRLI